LVTSTTLLARARSLARYTVERATPNSSASSAGPTPALTASFGYDAKGERTLAEPGSGGWAQLGYDQAPGTTGNASIVRVGEADSQNPTGYVRYYNSGGQPLTIFRNPGTGPDTHLPLEPDPEPNPIDPIDPFLISYTGGC